MGPFDICLGTSSQSYIRFVKRKATKAARKLPPNFDELKDDFIDRIRDKVTTDQPPPPPDLVINFVWSK